MDLGAVAFLGAFAAGVLSFASPCVFPLIPA
jgi:cytochrome c biogenesis protein CcdA